VALWLVSTGTAIAQVKVTLSAASYKVHVQIQAKIENKNAGAITICIEVGQWSPKGTATEATLLEFPMKEKL